MPDAEFNLQAEFLALKAMISGIGSAVREVETKVMGLQGRLDQLVASHNQVGENIAWLTANTQGIFAMLNDPKFISQMMGGMMSGMGAMGGKTNARAEAAPADGPTG